MNIDITKLRERIEEIQQIIRDAAETNRENKTAFPQRGHLYYWVSPTGMVECDHWRGSVHEHRKLEFGNVFQTATEAENHAKRWKELRLITERMLAT